MGRGERSPPSTLEPYFHAAADFCRPTPHSRQNRLKFNPPPVDLTDQGPFRPRGRIALGGAAMNDTKVLLERIAAFRQRLEKLPAAAEKEKAAAPTKAASVAAAVE